jgi:hypothetical protein
MDRAKDIGDRGRTHSATDTKRRDGAVAEGSEMYPASCFFFLFPRTTRGFYVPSRTGRVLKHPPPIWLCKLCTHNTLSITVSHFIFRHDTFFSLLLNSNAHSTAHVLIICPAYKLTTIHAGSCSHFYSSAPFRPQDVFSARQLACNSSPNQITSHSTILLPEHRVTASGSLQSSKPRWHPRRP